MSDLLAEQLNRTFAALAERIRAAVDDHIAVTAGQLAAAIQADRQTAADAAARDAGAAAERAVSARLADEFARREEQLREAGRAEWFEAGLTQGRQEAVAAIRHDHRRVIERLAAAVRALSDSTSLSETLDALTDAARAEADRVAVFLVRGDALRLWAQVGFDTLDDQPAFELSLSEAGPIAEAVRAAAPRHGRGGGYSFAVDSSAAFAAVPLQLNGQVVAVLCAEDASADDAIGQLISTLGVLALLAARVLESLTVLRLAHSGAPGVRATAASSV